MRALSYGSAVNARRRGFSLLELLVASALMVIVLGGLMVILVTSVQLQVVQQGLADAQQNARIVSSLMSTRLTKMGTGLFPRTLTMQTRDELWEIEHVAQAAAASDPSLTKENMVFGFYYTAQNGPLLLPLNKSVYEMDDPWQPDGDEAYILVAAPHGFRVEDLNGGVPLVALNAGRVMAIASGGASPLQKIKDIHTKALVFTNLTSVNVTDPVANNPDPALYPSEQRVYIKVDKYDPSWVTGKADAGGDFPILIYPGAAHVAFAWRHSGLMRSDGTPVPGGTLYMAEFNANSLNAVVESQKARFRAYADNVVALDIIGFYANGSSRRIWQVLDDSGSPFMEGDLQQHFNDRPNLRMIEIRVVTRTSEPVPAGRATGLFIPGDTGYVYRVVSQVTRVHLQSFYLRMENVGSAGGEAEDQI